MKELNVKKATGSLDNIGNRVYQKLVECGFEGVLKIGAMKVDHKLISAIVERWRPETFTIHFSVGEVTITLQDVELLTGLCVDGAAVTGCTTSSQYLTLTCCELLGKIPSDQDIKGKLIKLKWLKENFSVVPENASDVTIEQYTRGFLLILFGGLLFSNSGGGGVNVMWLRLLEHLTGLGYWSI